MIYSVFKSNNNLYNHSLYNGLNLKERLIPNSTYILIPFSIKYWLVNISKDKTLKFKLKPEIEQRFLKLNKN